MWYSVREAVVVLGVASMLTLAAFDVLWNDVAGLGMLDNASFIAKHYWSKL